MSANLTNQLLILIGETLTTALLLLGLFRLKPRFGFSPLYIALGVFQPIQMLLASSLYVEIVPGLVISPGSVIMFTASLFAILLVYICEDAIEARKLIYGIVIANLTMTLFLLVFAAQLRSPGARNLINLPREVFVQGARVMFTGTIALFGDAILIIFVYEWVRRFIKKFLFLRVYLTMAIILTLDTLIFGIGSFYGQPNYGTIVFSGIVGKVSMAAFYAAVLTVYFRLVEPIDYLSSTARQPFRDIFFALTYREKYEIERERAERAVRESEQKLRGVIEQSVDGIAITDERGSIIIWNQSLEEITGLTAKEMIGKAIWDAQFQMIPEGQKTPEEHQRLEEDLLELMKTGKSTQMGSLVEREIRHSNRTTLFVQGETFPIKTNQGIILGNITRDITDQVRADEALQKSEARLASIIDFAMDAIITLDADQHIILFNPAAEKLFRCPADEAMGQPLDRFIPERFREAHHEHVRMFSQTDQTSRSMGTLGAFTCLRADGKEFPAEITISQSELAGRKIYTAILRDITTRVQAEKALNRRVDELGALYQTTLDIISFDDLTDLLNIIVMRAVDLLDGTGGGLYLSDPEKQQVRCVISYNALKDYTGTALAYGEGAAGTVAATGEPLIIDDYQTWEGRAETFEIDRPFSAVISVPMLWQGQVTGVIHVLHDSEKHKFTGEDLKLLTSFANQAAVAVENARLFEETQRRLERLSALRRIDQVITSNLDLRVTLNILLGQILQQLEVDAAAVLLYRSELQRLEFVAGQGFRTQALQSTNLHLGEGFAGQAALEQRVVQVLDLNQLQTGFLRSPEFRNEGFVAYIGVPLITKGNITGVLEIYHRQRLEPDREWLAFLETLAGQAAIAIDNINLFNDLQMSNLELIQAYDATIEGWARALELRDMETEGHSRRVVDMTLELARKLGVEEGQLVHIRQGALLHDIGKMGVPDSILQKTGPLTDEEWEIVHQHPIYAHKWLMPISYLQPALAIPYCHHEKWNGTGYPRGLKGEQIPLAARIFAVVDVWDALCSDRPYRPAWSREKVVTYLREQSGKQFDPQVLDEFLSLLRSEGKI